MQGSLKISKHHDILGALITTETHLIGKYAVSQSTMMMQLP